MARERLGVREISNDEGNRLLKIGLPFSTWSLTKLAEFLVAEGVVDDISHEGRSAHRADPLRHHLVPPIRSAYLAATLAP